MSSYYIPVDNNVKHQIVSLLSDAVQNDVKEIMATHYLGFFNSVHFLTWDFIYTRVYKRLNNENIICIKCRRGPWSFVLVYDLQSKYLYSFMKDKRLDQLIGERKNRSTIHYLDALVTLNTGINELNFNMTNVEQQLELLPLEEDSDWLKAVEKILRDMLGIYYGKIEKYVTITFNQFKGEVQSVKATLLSPNMDIIYQEDWSEFINVDYDKSDYSNFNDWNFDDDENEEDDLVKLKPDVEEEFINKDGSEEIVGLKTEDKEQQEKEEG
ncbi:DUF5986 family protein [Anoxybacillus flavithermus]|uniref:DUF5986 family protein n=1 Tax=Anoxybacillus flavithermus TaxID=33934 RepID=UPI001868124B|nr:DUF5986 family protein [Anoxybacillus flavithermus]MBE2907619.1 hypothetical protein [Anoxybacillus flavithermus]MBE2911353.1 hypothetical protein [Anoxybacillus flavithermus]